MIGDASDIANGVTAVLQYVGQGYTLQQAIAMAVASGKISATAAAQIGSAAGQVASGAQTVQQAALAAAGVSSVSQFFQTTTGKVVAVVGVLLILKTLL